MRYIIALIALPASLFASPSSANSLGIKAFAEEDFPAALSYFQDAIRLAPAEAEYHNNAGMCLLHMDNPALAFRYFRTASTLRPDLALYHYNAGLAAQASGDSAAAEASFRAALARSATYFDAAARLGVVLYQASRKKEAVEVWRKAVSIKPDAAVYNLIGVTLLDLDSAEEAASALERSVALDNANPEAHYNLGNALRRLRQSSRALGSYARSVQLNPGFYPAIYNLALTQLELNQKMAAKSSLEMYLRTLPPHLTQQKADAEKKLKEIEGSN